MICPKCKHEMLAIYYKGVTVDRCTNCIGIWFDALEAELLKNEWMSEHLDSGNPKVGKFYNATDDIGCPHCDKAMIKMYDQQQPHIWFEVCPDGEGKFFDAGEFKDWIYCTPLDRLRDIVKGPRPGGLPG